MSPERWRRIEQVYHSALEKDADQWGDYLLEACGGDEDLREQIDSLLQQKTASGNLLNRPVWEHTPAIYMDPPEASELVPGTRFGAYRIQSVLNKGGMGVVY